MLYTDSAANFKITDGRMSLQSRNQHAEIRHLLILDWCKKNRLTIKWQSTTGILADLGTNNLHTEQFVLLRDHVTGYWCAKMILSQRNFNSGSSTKTAVETAFETKLHK